MTVVARTLISMTIADPGKIELNVPRASGLRDLSSPEVREKIVSDAKRDAQKSVLRARRSKRLLQSR